MPHSSGQRCDWLRLAATSVVQYSRGSLADRSSLIAAMASIGGLPAATIDAGCRAGAAFALAVIERSVGADCRDAFGLSVFTPDSYTVFSANRAEYARLRFPTLTGWDAVLDVVYGHYSDEVHLAARSVPAPVPVEAATDDPIILLG